MEQPLSPEDEALIDDVAATILRDVYKRPECDGDDQ
jgi:hypothetical protein